MIEPFHGKYPEPVRTVHFPTWSDSWNWSILQNEIFPSHFDQYPGYQHRRWAKPSPDDVFFLFQRHLGVSTNASTLQWMVDSMVKPMKVDDLGETPILDTLGHLQLTKSWSNNFAKSRDLSEGERRRSILNGWYGCWALSVSRGNPHIIQIFKDIVHHIISFRYYSVFYDDLDFSFLVVAQVWLSSHIWYQLMTFFGAGGPWNRDQHWHHWWFICYK